MSRRLYYLDDIPTPYRLGVQRRISEEWNGAFKIAYCAAAEPGRDWSFDFSNLDVEILPGRQYRPKRQVNPFSYKLNPAVIWSLSRFNPDVVVMSGYVQPTMILAVWWCLLKKKPYGIVSETSCRNSVCSGWKWYAKRLLFGRAVGSMAFGLPVGREAADYLRALGRTNVPMAYFPNTPDTSLVAAQVMQVVAESRESELRRRFGLPPRGKIVLFAGRLIRAKRPMDAVQAFQRLGDCARDAILVFAGDGPLMPDIVAASHDDSRIFCTGWLRDPLELISLMAISSMMVLSSEHEPWGAVVNEAMAAGLPVVASDRVGAAAELIEPGRNGLIYPVGQTAELAGAIGMLLADKALRQQMGQAAQATALSKGVDFAASNLIAGALYGLRVSSAYSSLAGHPTETGSHS